ncbi:MAG: glycosyltransferase family 1 protein [Nanoarchaeota archaeon]|nr:glycosyltransferase family 1 protein [Nanoarchaeota archaeon]
MRIGIDCHTLEKTKTGVARYLTNLLDYWKSEDRIEFIKYSMDNVKNPFNIKSTALYYNFSLPRKAKKDKIDILFLPFYMRPFFCKIPTAVAIHDISYTVHPKWFDFYHRFAYNILTKRAIRKSKVILVPSRYTKSEILKYYKVNPQKIHIVLLAADEKFNAQKNYQKIEEVKNKYGLKEKYIFYTGSIFNRRHVLELIKAFKIILKKFPDYQLLISGRNLTNPFQDIDKEIEKIQQIRKIDYIDDKDLVYLYQGAELFTWPSEYEGFGLPPLEAMACGTPVLTTSKTSLAEVLGDYPIVINNPGDIEEIKDKMLKIISDENLRKEMIAKGLERAKSFSWRQTAEETLEILIQ